MRQLQCAHLNHAMVLLNRVMILPTHMNDRIHLLLPAGEPSRSPRFPLWFMEEFQGIIAVEISSLFPCGNSGEIKENFYVDISTSFPCRIPDQGNSPRILKWNGRRSEGSQLSENIPVMIRCHSLVNKNVYRFGVTSLSLQPGFENSPEFPCGFDAHDEYKGRLKSWKRHFL